MRTRRESRSFISSMEQIMLTPTDLRELNKIIPFKFRVGPKTKSGNFAVLGYIDARDCMDLLDDVIGAAYWGRKYYTEKNNLFCSVGVQLSEDHLMNWKDDCGTESNTEQEKGEASDAFKRACVNWGIGRFLYTLPRLYISSEEELKNKYNITDFVRTKYKSQLTDRFNSYNK